MARTPSQYLMSRSFLEYSKPSTYTVEKPIFPTIPPTTQLKDLVGPHSFIILGINYEGLPVQWEECDSFRDARNFGTTVKGLNDLGERASR